MALVAATLGYLPERGYWNPGAAGASIVFDTTLDSMYAIFQVPLTGTLSYIHYRCSAAPGVVATLRCELRTVTMTTGQPAAAGTLYGSSTTITRDASTLAANTNYADNVNATGAVAGEYAAAVLDYSAYTSGSLSLIQNPSDNIGNLGPVRGSRHPYRGSNTSGSNANLALLNALALEYSGGIFVPMGGANMNWVGVRNTAAVINTGVTRRGNKFTPRVKRRAIGIYATVSFSGAIVLQVRLASDQSIIATCTPDKDVQIAGVTTGFHLFDSGATFTPTVGTAYYIQVEGTDGTGAAAFPWMSDSPVAVGDGAKTCCECSPGGMDCIGTYYTLIGTTQTDDNTTRYDIGLMTDQEDDGASAGGGGGLQIVGRGGLAG